MPSDVKHEPGVIQEVVILEYSLVPQGANPPAFVAMTKEDTMKCDKCGAEGKPGEICKCGEPLGKGMGSGEARCGKCGGAKEKGGTSETMCKACGPKHEVKKSLWARTVEALTNLVKPLAKSEPEEPEPKTTGQILQAQVFWSGFSALREAFGQSMQEIAYSNSEDKVAKLKQTTEEFLRGLDKVAESMSAMELELLDKKFEQLDMDLSEAMNKELKTIPEHVSAALDAFEKDKEPTMATPVQSPAPVNEALAKEVAEKDARIKALEETLAKEQDAKLEKEFTEKVKGWALPGIPDEAALVKDLVSLSKANSPLLAAADRVFAAAKAVTSKTAGVMLQANGATGGDNPNGAPAEHAGRVESLVAKELTANPALSKEQAYSLVMARKENAPLLQKELVAAGYQAKASTQSDDAE